MKYGELCLGDTVTKPKAHPCHMLFTVVAGPTHIVILECECSCKTSYEKERVIPASCIVHSSITLNEEW